MGSELGKPRELLQELFFDSVEDPSGGLASMGASIWDTLPLSYDFAKIEALLLQWETPAQAWRTLGGVPPLRDQLSGVVSRACQAFCRRQAASRLCGGSGPAAGGGRRAAARDRACLAAAARRLGNASEDCCRPEVRCPRVHRLLGQLLSEVEQHFLRHVVGFNRQWDRVHRSRWPMALPSLLPHVLKAMRVVEEAVRFSAVMWSRYPSNPTLRGCLSSSWGESFRSQQLKVLKLWRGLRRGEEVLLWQLAATSRFEDTRWSALGLQTDPLRASLQEASNVLIAFRGVLTYLERRADDLGWGNLTAPAPDADAASLDPAAGGEYPGIKLDYSMFAGKWFLDKGVLRFLLRRVFAAGQTVAEFGAFGGEYSAWLNDTGLVEAFAYDAIPRVNELSEGRVSHLQLSEPFDLGRRFDWVLCLEVGEHMSKQSEDVLMQNIARHAAVGAIISWGTPDYPSPYHPNLLTVEESTRLIQRHGFVQDGQLTEQLREATSPEFPWLRQTTAVYYSAPTAGGSAGGA